MLESGSDMCNVEPIIRQLPRTIDIAAETFLQQLRRHFENDHPDVVGEQEGDE